MNERMRFNPVEAAAAGDADARSLLLSIEEGDIPTGQLSDAIGEIVGLAAENRMEECTARLEAFCNILGPALHRAANLADEAKAEPSHDTAEAERIAGAKQCIGALAKLLHSAENLPEAANNGAVYYAIQADDAETLVAQFAPLTPRQEGAFRTLAEYIHCDITSGTPNLERWRPVVAKTSAELQAELDGVAGTESEGGEL